MAAGIYEITAPSGHRYIGSAVDIERRWVRHRKDLRAGKHGNINLQRAAAKYGADRLAFNVLIICAPADALMFEQRAIDGLRPTYNIAPVAGSSRGIKRSAEFKAKVSRGLQGRIVSAETRAKIGAKHRGKKLSPDHVRMWHAGIPALSIEERRARARILQTPAVRAKKAEAMKGHATSASARAKISAALKGRPHSPERIAAIRAGKRAAITLQDGS